MVTFDRSDLEHILRQIQMAENDQPPVSPHLAFGLREVSGTSNNTVPGQDTFGAADQIFPRLTDPLLLDGQALPFDPDGPGGQAAGDATSYLQTGGFVADGDPRTISNLIADQTAGNAAALEAQAAALDALGTGYRSTNVVAIAVATAAAQAAADAARCSRGTRSQHRCRGCCIGGRRCSRRPRGCGCPGGRGCRCIGTGQCRCR